MNNYTEEDLFEDDDISVNGNEGGGGGALAGEYSDDPGNEIEPEEVVPEVPETQPDYSGEGSEHIGSDDLDGVERFLSSYGIQGGMIEFEDGEATHFSELSAEEQENVLESLTMEAVPTIEEKYNLDEAEINLLNVLRESDQSPEDFINNLVDYRLGHALAQRDAASIDFENMPAESMYVRHLIDTNPEMSDDEIASELEKAKNLSTFDSTVDTIKNAYIAEQQAMLYNQQREQDEAFYNDLELQREAVVQTVEGINDISGAPITNDMKEYLLGDIMELNEDRDPILMEKIFSDPQTMFEVNWFINYGKDYINNINDYWKKEVSKAAKNGYNKAVRGMSGTPISRNAGDVGRSPRDVYREAGPGSYGEIASEEDLFE